MIITNEEGSIASVGSASCLKAFFIVDIPSMLLKEAFDALKTSWLGFVPALFPFCDHY